MGIKELEAAYQDAKGCVDKFSPDVKTYSPYLTLRLCLEIATVVLEKYSPLAPCQIAISPKVNPVDLRNTLSDGCYQSVAESYGYVRASDFVRNKNISNSTLSRFLCEKAPFKGCGVKTSSGDWFIDPIKTMEALKTSTIIMNRMKKGIFEAARSEEGTL